MAFCCGQSVHRNVVIVEVCLRARPHVCCLHLQKMKYANVPLHINGCLIILFM